MATIANIAQAIVDEHGYTAPDDITLVKLENNIDNVIDYVNLETRSSIADLTGGAGTKSLVCDEKYIPLIKLLSALMVKAYLNKGPDSSMAGLSVSFVVSDPQYVIYRQIIDRSLKLLRLRDGYFKRT